MILTLDPGLDDTGFALWRWPERAINWANAHPWLVDSGTWYTKTTESLETRLYRLAVHVRDTVADRAVRVVFIEMPSVSHARYARSESHGQKQSLGVATSMQQNTRTAGVLHGAAAIAGARVELVQSSATKKASRAHVVRCALPEIGRSSEHQRDAIYLGLTVLADHRRSWKVA